MRQGEGTNTTTTTTAQAKNSTHRNIPCAASGNLPLAGQVKPSLASVRPRRKGTLGPPKNSTATCPPSTHRSAKETSGCAFLMGKSKSLTIPNPALASSVLSGENRMVAPLDPPVLSSCLYVPVWRGRRRRCQGRPQKKDNEGCFFICDATNVPLACHANRMAMGQALAF